MEKEVFEIMLNKIEEQSREIARLKFELDMIKTSKETKLERLRGMISEEFWTI